MALAPTSHRTRALLAASVGILVFLAIAYALMQQSSTDVTTWRKNWHTTQSEYTITQTEPELSLPEGATLYRNEEYNFKLAHPRELVVTEERGEGTATITFKNADSSRAFQIFITPYVGWFITEDRIQMDIPSGKIEEPVEVLVDGARGTIFFSEDPTAGRMREVWFIHGDYLYEVTTYHLLDEWLSYIMTTWRFLKEPAHTAVFEGSTP